MLSHYPSKSLVVQSHLRFKHLEGVGNSLKFCFHGTFQLRKVLEYFLQWFDLEVELAELGVVLTRFTLKELQRSPQAFDTIELFCHLGLDGVHSILNEQSKSTLYLHECELVFNCNLLFLHVIPCNREWVWTWDWWGSHWLCSTCCIIGTCHSHCCFLTAGPSGCATRILPWSSCTYHRGWPCERTLTLHLVAVMIVLNQTY